MMLRSRVGRHARFPAPGSKRLLNQPHHAVVEVVTRLFGGHGDRSAGIARQADHSQSAIVAGLAQRGARFRDAGSTLAQGRDAAYWLFGNGTGSMKASLACFARASLFRSLIDKGRPLSSAAAIVS